MKKRTLLLLLLMTSLVCGAQDKLPLAGEWHFTIDRDDQGISHKWYLGLPAETILLPGSMTTAGKGDEINIDTPWTGQVHDSVWFKNDEYAKYRVAGNIKIPSWLQPVKYYKGVAWYIRKIKVPHHMAGRPLEALFERVHWESTLWVDGQVAGTNNSLGTPHRYAIKPLSEGEHILALRVDNRVKDIDVGINAHSISDHTQSNWNGVIGEMSLTAKEPVSIQNVALYPDLDKAEVRVEIWVDNKTDAEQTVVLKMAASSRFTPALHAPSALELSVKAARGVTKQQVSYPMGDFYKWDEFTPYLYTMKLSVNSAQQSSYDFGMRKFESRGRGFYINDRPVFLRGTLECAIFPKTGYPPMNEMEWARIFNICKAHGLNHVRFHSWCPPRAAFRAADRTGVYIQVEGGGWCTVGNGGEFDRWIYAESDRILAEYGNHPSFVMYAYGNEPDGENQEKFLGDLVSHLRSKDSRHLYTSAAGWPMVPQNEYRNDPSPRLKAWGSASPLNAQRPRYDYQFDKMIAKCDVPWVSHEIGQWCVYPDFKEIAMYDDAVLQAKNFEIFRETLAQNGLASYANEFLLASGKLQTLLYKAEIESALRTRDFSGFQLLDLHDFPGQGTALVGVLNPFWESKGYVSAEEYHQFSSAVVPLIRTNKITYYNNEMFTVPVEVANFGANVIRNCAPAWRLTNSNGVLFASGNLPRKDIGFGNCISLGSISHPLSSLSSATKLTLTVELPSGSNSWDFWVYPPVRSVVPDGVKVCQELDEKTTEYLVNGGSVLLTPKRGVARKSDVKCGFSTIFWNSSWTVRRQPPLTLGLLIEAQHPALKSFPTEYHSNYQWYEFCTDAAVADLTAMGSNLKPIVRVVDDWFRNRSLGLIFEARVGKGKLLYCGADLIGVDQAEVHQMMNSLFEYMGSSGFNPTETLSDKELKLL